MHVELCSAIASRNDLKNETWQTVQVTGCGAQTENCLKDVELPQMLI